MALKLKEFARSDIKSEQIHNSPSDESDDGILYLPPPAAGKSLEKVQEVIIVELIVTRSKKKLE